MEASSATTPPTTPAGTAESFDAPTAAYRDWLAALERRDAAGACAVHAPELTIELRYEAILVDRAELGDPCTGFVALLWEDPTRQYDPVTVETTRATDEGHPGRDLPGRLRDRAAGLPPRFVAGALDEPAYRRRCRPGPVAVGVVRAGHRDGPGRGDRLDGPTLG